MSKGSETKDLVKSKGKTMLAMRKIRKYEEDFDPRDWVNEAMVVYLEAHKAMADGDEDRMHEFVTEKAFPEMMNMAKRKTIRWGFVKSLEEPKVGYKSNPTHLLQAQPTPRWFTRGGVRSWARTTSSPS